MLVVKCAVVEPLITYLLMSTNCMINDLGAGSYIATMLPSVGDLDYRNVSARVTVISIVQ